MVLDVDPVGLVRKRRGEGEALEQYVNDRPYVASSFLSVMIAQVFGSDLAGRSKDKPKLVKTALPLTAKLAGVQKAAAAFPSQPNVLVKVYFCLSVHFTLT